MNAWLCGDRFSRYRYPVDAFGGSGARDETAHSGGHVIEGNASGRNTIRIVLG